MAAAETPLHPRDLTQHRCIGWRSSADVAPYRWELSKGVLGLAVAVDREVTTDGIDLMAGMALAGACLTAGMEETFAPR
jgi:DNA-binding transcriptional LysR family regulator